MVVLSLLKTGSIQRQNSFPRFRRSCGISCAGHRAGDPEIRRSFIRLRDHRFERDGNLSELCFFLQCVYSGSVHPSRTLLLRGDQGNGDRRAENHPRDQGKKRAIKDSLIHVCGGVYERYRKV